MSGQPTRETVSRERLFGILNEQLAKYDSCEGCQFGGPIHSQKPDESGCNWSADSLYLWGTVTTACARAAVKAVAEARRRYNLSE